MRLTDPNRPRIITASALTEVLTFLAGYEDLEAIFRHPEAIPCDLDPRCLLTDPHHGNITGLCLDTRNGQTMVGVSIQDRHYRWLHPLDFAAIRLGMAFGIPLTIQASTDQEPQRHDYPRFRVASSVRPAPDFLGARAQGWNVYLLRVLTDAPEGHTASYVANLRLLNAAGGANLDHHYLGRDAIRTRPVEEAREEGKKTRSPRLGRKAFNEAALHYFDLNAARTGYPITRDQYALAIETAWRLALSGVRIVSAIHPASAW